MDKLLFLFRYIILTKQHLRTRMRYMISLHGDNLD